MRCPATVPGSGFLAVSGGRAAGTLVDVQCDREKGHDQIALSDGQSADHGNEQAALWWDDSHGEPVTPPPRERIVAAWQEVGRATTTLHVALRGFQRALDEVHRPPDPRMTGNTGGGNSDVGSAP